MEMFKDRKKNRRKKANENVATNGIVSNGNGKTIEHGNVTEDNAVTNHGHGDNPKVGKEVEVEAQAQAQPSITDNNEKHAGGGAKEDLPVVDLETMAILKKKKKKAMMMKRQLTLDSASALGDEMLSTRQELDHAKVVASTNQKHQQAKQQQQQQHYQDQEEPQKQESVSSSPRPPGFNATMSLLALDDPSQNDSNGLASSTTSSLNDGPMNFHQPAHHALLPPGSRCIVIREHDIPIPAPLIQNLPLSHAPKTSLAVAAAKAFVDLYYRHINLGLSSDLATYYTPHAQKSISVGGAHSVVATRSDIMLQLSSLSQSIFVVRGVVSQDTFDGRGAHVLVTGVVQTGGVLTQFAHTISLVPVPQHGQFSFQIHNDALSLLTSGDEVAQNGGGGGGGVQQQGSNVPHYQGHQQQGGFHQRDGLASRPPGLGL